MKNLFPVVALATSLLSMSSFTTADSGIPPVSPVVKEAKRAFIWPITGTTTGRAGAGQPVGSIKYSISGGDVYPSSITFTTTSGTFIGSYSFSYQSTNTYYATGMYDQTFIKGVYFRISGSCGTGYCVEFISLA